MAKNKLNKIVNEAINEVGKETLKEYKKASSETKRVIWLSVLSLVIFISFATIIVSVSALMDVKNVGEKLGDSIGYTIGFFEGAMDAPNAYREGKKVGISAEDTETAINNIKETGKLEVYVAGITITNLHKYGEDTSKYVALYLAKGYAIFTTDLEKANIKVLDDKVYIELPEIETEVYIDDSATSKIAEYQCKDFWKNFENDAEDGYDAYLNTFNKSKQDLKESIENYDSLIESAKKAAKESLSTMMKAIFNKESDIVFISEG